MISNYNKHFQIIEYFFTEIKLNIVTSIDILRIINSTFVSQMIHFNLKLKSLEGSVKSPSDGY